MRFVGINVAILIRQYQWPFVHRRRQGVEHDTKPEEQIHCSAVGSIDAVDEKMLYRRIDRHIMPLMFFCYLLQFLDKVLINYANIVSKRT